MSPAYSRKPTVLVLALLCFAAALAAHDTWLVPAQFRVTPGEPVRVALNTSEDFPSSEAAATPDRIARFEVVGAGGRRPVTGYRVEGNALVAEVTPGAGLTLVATVTKPRLIVLEQEIFNTYLREEGLEPILAARTARGQTYAEGRERYSKIAKLALCADSSAEQRRYREPLGLRLEIVPLTNPCGLRAGDVLVVRVLFEGRPLVHAWVAAGTAGTHGHHSPFRQTTDADGRVIVPLDRSGAWFVRALHMVPSTEFADADWQSWFSTFTFAVE
ncbi:MAG: DUF4198 domain-containing protein [Candidatus Acidoferrales bacterium]